MAKISIKCEHSKNVNKILMCPPLDNVHAEHANNAMASTMPGNHGDGNHGDGDHEGRDGE